MTRMVHMTRMTDSHGSHASLARMLYTLQFPEPAFLLVTDQKERRLVFCFVINMATQFHSDRRLDDFAATDLPIFLSLVLEKSESICQSRADQTVVEEHVAVLDLTVSLLRSLRDSGNVDTDDKETLDNQSDLLEDLLGLGFSHTKISEMLGISRWNISRRVRDYGLQDFTEMANGEYGKFGETGEFGKIVRNVLTNANELARRALVKVANMANLAKPVNLAK